jgi:hypothetical protein
MRNGTSVIDVPHRDGAELDELRDEGVVSLEPQVREALARVAPEPPSGRWRILAYKWFVLLHRTD